MNLHSTASAISGALLSCALFALALSAPAAQVVIGPFTNSVTGLADTNVVRVIPVSGPVANADGSFSTIGIPLRLTPTADGSVTNALLQNNYLATNAFLGKGIYFRVPNDFGPTVYRMWDLMISGGNVFVTISGGTNVPPTFNQITNAVGGTPALVQQVTNTVIASIPTNFWNASANLWLSNVQFNVTNGWPVRSAAYHAQEDFLPATENGTNWNSVSTNQFQRTNVTLTALSTVGVFNTNSYVSSNNITFFTNSSGQIFISSTGGGAATNAIDRNAGFGTNTTVVSTLTATNIAGSVATFTNLNAAGSSLAIGSLHSGGSSGSVFVGGSGNLISSGANLSTIEGGTGNIISSPVIQGLSATILGGSGNIISNGSYTVIAGGNGNFSSGTDNLLGGGTGLSSSGQDVVLLGDRGNVTHDNVFLWNDGFASFSSFVGRTFLVNAVNGVGINTNNPGTNALRVRGNVDADGFSIRGVPISGLGTNTTSVTTANTNLLTLTTNSGTVTFSPVNQTNGMRVTRWTTSSDTASINGSNLVGVISAGVSAATTNQWKSDATNIVAGNTIDVDNLTIITNSDGSTFRVNTNLMAQISDNHQLTFPNANNKISSTAGTNIDGYVENTLFFVAGSGVSSPVSNQWAVVHLGSTNLTWYFKRNATNDAGLPAFRMTPVGLADSNGVPYITSLATNTFVNSNEVRAVSFLNPSNQMSAQNLTISGQPTFRFTTNSVVFYGAGNVSNNVKFKWSASLGLYSNALTRAVWRFQNPTWYLTTPDGVNQYSGSQVVGGTMNIVNGASPAPSNAFALLMDVNGIEVNGLLDATNLVAFTNIFQAVPTNAPSVGNVAIYAGGGQFAFQAPPAGSNDLATLTNIFLQGGNTAQFKTNTLVTAGSIGGFLDGTYALSSGIFVANFTVNPISITNDSGRFKIRYFGALAETNSVAGTPLGNYVPSSGYEALGPVIVQYAIDASAMTGTLVPSRLSGSVPLAAVATTANGGNGTFTGTFAGNGVNVTNIATTGGAIQNMDVAGANTRLGFATTTPISGGGGETAFGYTALQHDINGTAQTALGKGALQAITNGFGNVSIGYESTFNLEHGDYNLAIGQDALFSALACDSNTAVGQSVMVDLITGQNNTGVGFGTLADGLTNGIGNTVVGAYAFDNLNAGAGNVGIGTHIGTNLLLGSGNILIGPQVQTPSTTSGGTLNIGQVIFGSGLWTNVTSAASGVQASGKVGINVVSPTSALEVNGDLVVTNGSISGLAFGNLYRGTSGLLLPSSPSPQTLTNYLDISTNGFIGSPTQGTLTNLLAGRFSISFDLEYEGIGNGTERIFQVCTNGVYFFQFELFEYETSPGFKYHVGVANRTIYAPANTRWELKTMTADTEGFTNDWVNFDIQMR